MLFWFSTDINNTSSSSMSFRRPKARYKPRLPSSPATSTIFSSPATSSIPSSPATQNPSSSLPPLPALIPLPDAPCTKRPRHSTVIFLPGPEELVALPGRRTFTQPVDHRRDQALRNRPATPFDAGFSAADDKTEDSGHRSSMDLSSSEYLKEHHFEEHHLRQRERQHGKVKRQHSRWTNLITSLVPLHLRLLRETKCLRDPPQDTHHICTCGSNVRALTVLCIYFQRTYILSCFFSASDLSPRYGIHQYQRVFVRTSSSAAPLARNFSLRSLVSLTHR
jgi:hypothetical protein